MRKLAKNPLVTIATLILLQTPLPTASAGIFRGPYDYSLGPYRGSQGWSYFESYNYFGVASINTYPYWGLYGYFWESPFTYGNGSRYPSIFGRPYRPGFYNPINPAYLTPPRAPGYTREYARDVVLPPMKLLNGQAAMIDVKMPCYGELWVDGVPTEQLGTDRLFTSPPLEKGAEYVYLVKARWLDGTGKPVEQTQEVRVHCGERVLVIFPKPITPPQP
jgi:uncharacterized protein (TIGR03000 family)